MLHLDLNRVLAHDRHTRLVTDAVNCKLAYSSVRRPRFSRFASR